MFSMFKTIFSIFDCIAVFNQVWFSDDIFAACARTEAAEKKNTLSITRQRITTTHPGHKIHLPCGRDGRVTPQPRVSTLLIRFETGLDAFLDGLFLSQSFSLKDSFSVSKERATYVAPGNSPGRHYPF